MTLNHIALLNIWRRKSKAAFVLIGLMIGVATMVALVGLSDALTMEINHKLEKYGANMIIVPKSEQLALAYEGMVLGGLSVKTGELAEADLAKLKTIKNASNIAAAGPMVLGPVKVENREVLLAGVDFKAAKILKPWWKIEGEAPGLEGAILGHEASQKLGLTQGRSVEIGGKSLIVTGILAQTGSQDDDLIFSQLATAQSILGMSGKISMVEVAALCIACPIEEMVKQISDVLPGAKVTAIQSVVKGRMETLKYFKRFSMGISALLFVVGSLVVLVTMMSSVKERTNEIGIFRAIGFRKNHILRIILFEATIVSAAAGVLGWLLGYGLGAAALPFLAEGNEVHVTFMPSLAAAALGVAVILGLISSYYPALTATRLDPHEALRAI